MYVVGVSSKLSNTIFTYKTWFLSYPPLSPFFFPFPADKRQCSCFFLETGTSKYPSISSNSVALVNQGFGVAEEQVTPISTTYGSVMFLTKLLTLPAVTRAMGTCYLGFGSKAALKPSHPQCLVSDCTSVCHHSCCVGSVVCGAVLKQITELCKLKYPQVNKKKIVFNDPVSGAVLLGSMDIIEETVAWRSWGGGGEGDYALCLPPHVGPEAHTALPKPLQSAEISPGFLWTVCARSVYCGPAKADTSIRTCRRCEAGSSAVAGASSPRLWRHSSAGVMGEVKSSAEEMLASASNLTIWVLTGQGWLLLLRWIGKTVWQETQQLLPSVGLVQIRSGWGPLAALSLASHRFTAICNPIQMGHCNLQLIRFFLLPPLTILSVFFCCPLFITKGVFSSMHSQPILPSNVKIHLSFSSGLKSSGVF